MSTRLPLADFDNSLPPSPVSAVEADGGRRRALLRVTPELLLWMGSGMFEVVANPLPEDAVMTGAFYDGERDTFTLVVESESFAPVTPGDLLPDLTPPTIRRLPVYES